MTNDLLNLISHPGHPLTIAGIIPVVGFLVTRTVLRSSPVWQLLCQLITIAGFTGMLLIAGVTPFKPTTTSDPTAAYIVAGVFKIVWWLGVSWLVTGIVRTILVFKRRPVETRFLQDLCAGVIYGGAVMGIIANVFDLAVSGLLAASGVIAIVLGLALQSTLGDLFSGIVLNISKPYHPGDWVILDGGLEGRVVDTNWRATRLLTPANDTAIIPNSLIAKARLVNASNPAGAHGLSLTIRLDATVAPSAGVAVLQRAMLSCNQILRMPEPTVTVRSLDAVALGCEMMFFVPLIEQAPAAQNEVFDLIYRHCAAAHIRLAPPAGSALVLPPRDPLPDVSTVPGRILERVPIFASLSDDQRLKLAPKMKRLIFTAGDVVVEEGVAARALFVLTSGVLVATQHHDTAELEVLRLAPGDCFGQSGLPTGSPTTFKVTALTRAVVYEIPKDEIAPVFKETPSVALELSQILASREAAGKARAKELDLNLHELDDLSTRVAHYVKLLFGAAG